MNRRVSTRTSGGGFVEPKRCQREVTCSNGCIAVVGNGGSITFGQAAMALQCSQIYRANYMNSASPCSKRASHCFFASTPDAFAGMRRRPPGEPSFPIGKAQALGINCPHSVFLDSYLADKNITWPGSSETFMREDLRATLSRHWDPDEPLNGVLPKDPFKKPSTGFFMIGYAMKHRGNKCVHLFGYNFWMRAVGGYKTEHAFQEEKRLVTTLLEKEDGVFFHPMMPVETWHTPGQLLTGL